MKPLNLIYKQTNQEKMDGHIKVTQVDVEATLQAIIDQVNELTPGGAAHVFLDPKEFTFPTKRFKATDIYIENNSWNQPTIVFKSEAEAQAALELLLNL